MIEKEQKRGLYTHAWVGWGRYAKISELKWSHSVGSQSPTLFDLASLTKAICTAPAIELLSRKNQIDIDQPIGGLPIDLSVAEQFKSITIKGLLTHTSGLPAWRNLWLGILSKDFKMNPQADKWPVFFNSLRHCSLTSDKPLYSDIGYIFLGYIAEALSGHSLDEVFRGLLGELDKDISILFRPLDHRPSEELIETAYCPLRQRRLKGEVHDENCASMGGVSGHAGLFGDGQSLAKLLEYILSEQLSLTRNKTKENPLGFWGWRPGEDGDECGFGGQSSWGHLGFTGTAFWVDPAKSAYGILLTNRVYFQRVNPAMTSFRKTVFSLLSQLAT